MFHEFMREGTPAFLFWSLVGLAIVIQGISKSGFAGGAGILSLPLMTLVMPVQKVAAVLLPLLILCDMNAIYEHRRNKDWKSVLSMYVPSIFGILLGAAVWWHIGQEGVRSYEPWIKRFVGVIALVFSLYIGGKEAAMDWIDRIKPGRKAAWVLGVSAGFCSTIAHAAGPIVSLYLFAQNLGKALFVGSVAWTFTLINLTKLPFYIAVGMVRRDVLLLDLVLIPFIPLGSAMGRWMYTRVSERLFNRVILVLVVLTGIQFLFDFDVVKYTQMLLGALAR